MSEFISIPCARSSTSCANVSSVIFFAIVHLLPNILHLIKNTHHRQVLCQPDPPRCCRNGKSRPIMCARRNVLGHQRYRKGSGNGSVRDGGFRDMGVHDRSAGEGAGAPSLPLPRQGTGIEKGVVLRQEIGRGCLARKIWSEVPARRGLAPRPRRHPGREDVEKRGRPPPGCRERPGRQRGRQGIGLGGNRSRHRRWHGSRLSHGRRPTRRVARVNKRSRQITVARRRGAAPTPVGARQKPWSYGASLESMGAVGGKVQLIYFII